VANNIVIVGGGLAGLAASIYLARAGRTVTVFEKRQYLGGRAITNLRHGYRFNLGAHAFYRAGAAAAVYRELGIPVPGKVVKPKAIALLNGEEHRLPNGILSLLTTSLLSLRGKRELAMALFRIRRFGGSRAAAITLREWIDANFSDVHAHALFRALIRMITFSDDPDSESAALPLAQMRVALRGGALYVDEGWQRIVDSLRSAAVASGVNFVSSSRIVGVHHDGEVHAVELGGLELDADRMDTQALAYPEMPPEDVEGARLPAGIVILAVDPITAAELAGDAGKEWADARPVHAACLDVALRSLPDPKRTFALGIDEAVYFSVHSAFAQLAPKGGALIHLLRYGSGDANTERTLESLLDRMQPGWRDVLVHRRYLPSMTASNALVTPSRPRPSAITNVPGLYLAGDWVGNEGMLSDAALASARAAAKAILSAP
jgi:phytoene dehydrogenase-like protein